MNSAVELRAKAQRIAHEARAKLDTINADGTNAAEVEAEFDRMIAEADALEARAKRYDEAEAREAAYDAADSRRPSEERVFTPSTEDAEERASKAFEAYVRSGSRAELRAQSVGTASEGGYLVPTSWANQITVALKAYGPLNDASVVTYLNTTTGGELNHPSLDDTANKGRKIGENTQVNGANLAFGTKPLNAYKYTTDVILVPSELLQDSAYDVAAYVTAAMAERMGRIINEVMTIGDGNGDPNGVATAASTGVTAVANSAIAADELINFQHSVDPAYRANASFMFADSTLAALRKLKDQEGRYIWQPGIALGAPATILGQTFHINQDMAAIGASAKSVLYGDFSKYVVRQVKGFEFKRLNERYADSDQVGFIGFSRYDGDLMDARAVKALVQAS